MAFQQFRTLLEEGFHVVDRIAGTGDFVTRGIHIHHETRRRDADQHQHHRANAFLPIVSTVRERHANSRQDQRDTGPERRLFLPSFFHALRASGGYARVFGSAPVATQQENQAARDHQTDDRRDDKRSKIPMTFGIFSASTTEVPVISALVKPMPMMAPIRV
nr:Uncharacterised protein [Klebsiella pneumoniae]